jgi:pectate lyase
VRPVLVSQFAFAALAVACSSPGTQPSAGTQPGTGTQPTQGAEPSTASPLVSVTPPPGTGSAPGPAAPTSGDPSAQSNGGPTSPSSPPSRSAPTSSTTPGTAASSDQSPGNPTAGASGAAPGVGAGGAPGSNDDPGSTLAGVGGMPAPNAPVTSPDDAGASESPPVSNDGAMLAFPGAEGFGRHATGARGGDVYHVTTLADSGEGSLRDAISVPNRTVIFDVAGVIELSERLIFQENLTIAGQTAPGGGITLYGNGTSFTNANNTIVRYVRFRMGVIGDSGGDTITMARGHDVIFDHCSISWARDGNFDLNQESGYELYNITLQDSIVAQGLQPHSTGGLINAAGVSVLRSLFIDNNSRNPKARQTLQWVNNVIYNWVASGYILGDTSGRSDGYLVGNYFIPGPETNGGTLDSPTDAYHVFAADNFYDDNRNGVLDGRLLGAGDFGTATWEQAPSVAFPPVTELSAHGAFDHVSQHAGASLWRDEVDRYVLTELASLGEQGATISDELALGLAGAVGDVPSGAAPADADRDGMPDTWETSHALDPNDDTDRNADHNGDGWTNLEEYINSL